MLQKFKITSCAFILCLFALTLMTVTPVFAADSAAFVQCQQIKPNGTSVALMKQKKNCFKNLAGPRNSAAFKQCKQIKPRGAFQPMKQKKNCFRDLARNAGGAGAPAGAPAVTAAGNTRLGNHGCGNPDRRTHVDCLRAKLDQTPLRQTVKMGPRGLGNYGCGNPDRKTHVNCLRAKLDQQGGGNGAPAVTAAGNPSQRLGKGAPGKASKRPLCNIRKGFLNKKGLKVRARECR
jgi:hypothetical protein